MDCYACKPLEMQLFDTKDSTVSPKRPKPRSGHRTVCDGKHLYSIGGYNPTITALDLENDITWRLNQPLFKELWKLHLATGVWERVRTEGTMPSKLASHSAVLWKNDRCMIVFGGTGIPFGSAASNHVFLCTLPQCIWHQMRNRGDAPFKQYGQGVFLQGDNLYVVGGTTGFDYSIDVHVLNLTTQEWTFLSSLNRSAVPDPRYRHELAMFKSKLFVLGGGTASEVFGFDKIPVFDVELRDWETVTSVRDPNHGFPAARRCHSAVQWKNEVYICGGYDGTTIHSDVWKLSLGNLSWHRLVAAIPLPTYFHAATTSQNGKMYVFGGVTNADSTQRTASVWSMWLTVPKLKDMCWEAILHYGSRRLTKLSLPELLEIGIPADLAELLNPRAEWG